MEYPVWLEGYMTNTRTISRGFMRIFHGSYFIWQTANDILTDPNNQEILMNNIGIGVEENLHQILFNARARADMLQNISFTSASSILDENDLDQLRQNLLDVGREFRSLRLDMTVQFDMDFNSC